VGGGKRNGNICWGLELVVHATSVKALMECNADTTVVGIGGPVGVSACGTVCSVTHRCLVCCL
jgi:hypothetical protein